MRRAILAVLAIILIGGLASAQGVNGPISQMSEDQARAMSGLAIHSVTLDQSGVPTFMNGNLGRIPRGDFAGGARRFIQDLGPVFRATGREDFVPIRTTEDDLGQVHVRMQQMLRGLPVVGGEMIVHSDRLTGTVLTVNGTFIPDENLPSTPLVGSRESLDVAAVEAGVADGVWMDSPELTYVVTSSGKTYLAWAARISYQAGDGEHLDRIFADAVTGDLVTVHAEIKHALNRKIYNGNHTNPDNPTLPGTLMFSEGGSSSDASAMDCYTNFGYTYNYYMTKFGRNSFDNAGATLIGTVHVGTNWVNAYWNGTQMVFGDGDGSNATYLSKALDIVAHELTHAVTDRTANLNYEKDSGALNEAMSDILAGGTEAYRDGAVSANTWKVGEEVWTPGTSGDALRYMNDPALDGSSADYYPTRNYSGTCTPSSSNDYCGVHTNSGIANLAFYLLSQGGTHPRGKTTTVVPAVTITKAQQIFYRALTMYMTATTNFQGARDTTAQAAADLYGAAGTEVNAVQATWNAVGVPGGPVTVTTLTNGQTVSNISGATGSWKNYKITVPASQTSLVIKISGGTGDADLYVKRGAIPTSSSYDYRPYLSGNNETVTVTNPVAGDWFISLNAYAAYSGVSLVATYTGGSTTPTLALAVSPTSLSIVQGSSKTTTATTTIGGGFNASVALSVSGLPSGASASFSPTSIAAPGGGSSTLTINAGTAAAGTSTVTVKATGGGLTKTATVSLTVTASGGGTTMNETESNNARSSANVVSTSGTKVTGKIGTSSDVDYFKVTIPANRTFTVDLVPPSTKDYDVYILNSSGTVLASGLNGTGAAEHISIVNGSSSKIYYVKVKGYYSYSSTLTYLLTLTW